MSVDDREPAPAGPVWAGRGLRLQFPPTPEQAGDNAEVYVRAVANIDKVNLDYSDASLQWVDGMLDHFRDDGSDQHAETIFCAGCYLGEVFVRNHGYHWGTVEAFGGMPVVIGPRGNAANPIGKAFKRVDNGEQDSLPFFLQVMLSD